MLCQAISGGRHKSANRITQVEALLKKIAETDRPHRRRWLISAAASTCMGNGGTAFD
jgi:hypothetical protein